MRVNTASVHPAKTFYDQMDETRRRQGRMLELLGFGPIETPSRVLFSAPAITLKAYGAMDSTGPPVLIVPAPIKRAYICDLVPWGSAVQQCLRRGFHVYLAQWERPTANEERYGLAVYVNRLIQGCIDAIEAEAGKRRVFVLGHSLGGTLSAIFAALNPDRVQGLVLLGAPLQFSHDGGALVSMVATAPRAQGLTALFGSVPGSLLNTLSVAASPTTFVEEPRVDWLASLADPEAFQMHMRVRRWALDELPMPSCLFEDVVELLYRENRFMRGTLVIAGQRAAPDCVCAPLLSVVEARSRIVPPESVLPFHDAARSNDTQVLSYEGDIGVALHHVGMLVGKSAHRHVWPEIMQWLHAHSAKA